MGNNELCALANAREIEKLPYETLKAMFPNVRYYVHGQRWHRKFLGHKTDKWGNKETYAVGEWLESPNGKEFDNPTMATMWAEMNYTKGHYKVVAFVPELHRVVNEIRVA